MLLAGRIKNVWSVLHRGCKPRRAEGVLKKFGSGTFQQRNYFFLSGPCLSEAPLIGWTVCSNEKWRTEAVQLPNNFLTFNKAADIF